MCKKLFYLVSFVLILSLTFTNTASAELVGWWRLDEGSGTIAYDSSDYGRDGTLQGDPEWVVGQIGGALDFDGDDHVDTGWSENLTNWTIACWAKSPAAPSGDSPSGPLHRENNYQFNWNHGDGTFRASAALNVGGTWYAAKYEPLEADVWYHLAATYDGETLSAYRDGELITSNEAPSGPPNNDGNTMKLGRHASAVQYFTGTVDDARVYDEALTQDDIQGFMMGAGFPYASRPNPGDGTLHIDTWVSLSWRAGDFAVTHDVYFGDNFDDVNDGAAETFQGNQSAMFFVVGFPGFPYPDGLVPGTTYYWRIDEVNDVDPNSPWKGATWSFSIPPKKAYDPVPADGATFVDPDTKLSWTNGFGAKLHHVYLGNNAADVEAGTPDTYKGPVGDATYNPGQLKMAKTYYWRVDEFDAIETHKGDVWSFTTEGAVANPEPSNGAVDIKQTPILSWSPAVYADSHQVYFGTDEEAVRNADTGSPEYKGIKALGSESYDTGKLQWDTTYYWRVDGVNDLNPDSPWVGSIWSFTTANFLIVDDFEGYDADDNQIWYAWHDGLGYGVVGTDPYYPGNGSGSAVGDESTPSYTEETIVHGGSQAMPLFYDNNKQGFFNYSEAELALTDSRDWTENGVNRLTIWFRGNPTGFVEGAVGTYTMSAAGADIWGTADEFRFAYKQLSGAGTISAQVLSVQNTDPWAKAGVMIRESLDPGSKFAFVCVTPGNGCRFQARLSSGNDATSDTSVVTTEQTAITAPYWVKLERDAFGNFSGFYSSNGVSWQAMSWNPQRISMTPNVYIGLALTSHSAGVTCEAGFSDVQTTGTVTPLVWTQEAIGVAMASNDPEQMYVALNGNAVVYNDNPNAALVTDWTDWNIDLQAFVDLGVNLNNVNTIALGLGDKNNPQAGGSGVMYFDDIGLYRPTPEPEELEPEPEPAP